jgi:soluble lytic murein transglycosylase-like protein
MWPGARPLPDPSPFSPPPRSEHLRPPAVGPIVLASPSGASLVIPTSSRRSVDPCLAAIVLAVSACAGARQAAPVPVPEPVAAAPPKTAARPARPAPSSRARRAAPRRTRTPRGRVDSTALEFAVTARLAHEPLARAIARRTRNPAIAERAAWAVTREAARLRVSPSLLAAVMLVENRTLDSAAVSSQGAIGLMQVMPIHAGSYGCGSDDLRNVDANICHGARILHTYLMRTRSVRAALRRYNGCVRGANTPRCYRYPVRVLRTAARLRRDILASAIAADRRVRM